MNGVAGHLASLALATKLIDKKLMTKDQVEYLNKYHARVYRELAPRLDKDHKAWLKAATRPI